MTDLSVSHVEAIRYRLHVNHVTNRLPRGSYVAAAYAGLQDTAPRDALLGLHARVDACEPSAWEDPGLIQTYSPRAAVYVLPRADLGVFTLGRLPLDPCARAAIEDRAETICRDLAGRERRGGLPGLREACPTGRLALRWTTSALYVREVPRPEIDLSDARRELCRRHVHAFGPTTPAAYAWWAGLSAADAHTIWSELTAELTPVELAGRTAWILSEDEDPVRRAPEPPAVRFLVASDLRMLGQDRHGLFVGPGTAKLTTVHDSFHPHGLLVDGQVIGAWGRRGGRVHVKITEPVTTQVRTAMETEVASMPIPGYAMTLTTTVTPTTTRSPTS